MNRIFNAVKLFILCGILFISGKAAAAEVDAEAMEIFRETVMQTAKQDNRVFRQDILLIMPQCTAELEFMGATERDKFNMTGVFEMWMVNDNGKVDYTEKPFYLTQDKQNMVVYFQNEKKKWQKSTTPVSAANLVDMVTTPNAQELDKMIEFVKDVTILQESETRRTLLVKIDCAKIFESIKAEMAKDPEIQKMANNETVNSFVSYIETGFKNADVWYTWTVDKINWQTVTMSFNLSSLPQNIASAVLNDSSQPLTSVPEIREILENLAFYSEFKGYTTFLNEDARANLEIPKKVLKAKEVKPSDDAKK